MSSSVTPAVKYEFHSADVFLSREGIVALKSRNLEGPAEDTFDWKYLRSPVGPARTWLAVASKREAPVGAASAFPRMGRLSGEEIRLAVNGDFAVDRDYRGFGPSLGLQKRLFRDLFEEGFDAVYGVPNREAEALLRRVGYCPLGSYERFVKVLRTEYKRGSRVVPWRGAAPILDALITVFSPERYRRIPSGVSTGFEEPSEVDGNGIATDPGDLPVLRMDRSPSFLHWRFAACPDREHRLFLLRRSGSKNPIGYIVYYTKENVFSITDVRCGWKEKEYRDLLGAFLCVARRMGAGSVDIRHFGNSPIRNALRSLHFLRHREAAGTFHVLVNPTSPCARALQDPTRWDIYEGDLD